VVNEVALERIKTAGMEDRVSTLNLDFF